MDPNNADVLVAEHSLCGDVPFDRDFQVVLDSLVDEFGARHPPATLREADRLYLRLREEVLRRVDQLN